MSTAGISKNRLFLILVIAVTALALVFYGSTFTGRTYAANETQDQPTKRTLNVAGQGTVYASPDIAYITLGVVTENEIAKTAQQENADAMSKIVDAIKSSGVKSTDIKTVNYSIYPKYNYIEKTGENKIIGYTVNNSVQVTVRDVTKVGSIIDLAAENGLNTSSSISFGLSDYEKYYNEALKNAVEIAKKRADTIAASLDITLKTPVSVSENGGYEPVYGNSIRYDAKTLAASPTPVESGNITITANVSMTYEY